MKRILLSLLFLSHFVFAQLPPETDPHRGMYVDKFLKPSQVTPNAVDPVFSILSVDTNCDGIFEKEDAVLNYACENHITYLTLYDLGSILGDARMAWNENTKQYEDCEKHLCRFMEKAKHEYGITQIGFAIGSPGTVNDIEDFLNRYPVSPACTTCQADLDVLNIEDEFWGDCAGDLPGFIAIMDAIYNLKNSYNATHPDNPLTTEAYLAFLDYCTSPGLIETAQVIDGCSNCSPFAGCSNPHPGKIDRVLYAIMGGAPVPGSFNEINAFENSFTTDSTDVHPIFYSTTMNSGATFDFLGGWLESDPVHTIFTAEDYFYYYWRLMSGAAIGQPRQNDVQPGGAQWFAQSHMVNRYDHVPVKVIETYCTSDSAKITLHYLGPDESGTNYEFWITRDSDGVTVYPNDGGKFTGVSRSTVNDPGNRTINFSDTTIFPGLYLTNGNYTTHISLGYDHGRGCSFSSEYKFVVDNHPRLTVSGKSEFCHGKSSMLTTVAGASWYSWRRNGNVIYAGADNFLKVTESGDYSCELFGGPCPATTDTVHVNVLTMPNGEINAVCNGNGTVTLKANLLPTLSSSTQRYGIGGMMYRWNTGATTDQITVSTPTVYRLLLTDPYSGCSVYRELKVAIPPTNTKTAVINVDSLPNGCNNDGVLSATLTPAVALYDPVRYLWSNGSTLQTISNLSAGTYWVTMKVFNQACSYYDSITIGTVTGSPVLNSVATPSSCINSPGGSVVLNPSGGNPPFQFEWKELPDGNGYNPLSRDQLNLYPGIYNLTVTDSVGCVYNYSFNVSNAAAPISVIAGPITQVTGCATNQNGSASVNITGGLSPYTQTWADINGQQFPTGGNLHAGSYRVVATDQSGCTGYAFIHVPSQHEPITTELLDSSRTKVTCDSTLTGSLHLCIHGGVMPYAVDTPWTFQLNIISRQNLPAGYYPYAIIDSAGCVFSDTLSVDSAKLILNAIPVHTTCVGCSNGEIQLSMSGGWPPYSISWIPSFGQLTNSTIKNLPAGNYSICVTDTNECVVCTQVIVLDDPLKTQDAISGFPFQLFPNPARQTITVNVEGEKRGDYFLRMETVYGQSLKVLRFETLPYTIDVSGIPPGIYFATLVSKHKNFKMIKFIKSP